MSQLNYNLKELKMDFNRPKKYKGNDIQMWKKVVLTMIVARKLIVQRKEFEINFAEEVIVSLDFIKEERKNGNIMLEEEGTEQEEDAISTYYCYYVLLLNLRIKVELNQSIEKIFSLRQDIENHVLLFPPSMLLLYQVKHLYCEDQILKREMESTLINEYFKYHDLKLKYIFEMKILKRKHERFLTDYQFGIEDEIDYHFNMGVRSLLSENEDYYEKIKLKNIDGLDEFNLAFINTLQYLKEYKIKVLEGKIKMGTVNQIMTIPRPILRLWRTVKFAIMAIAIAILTSKGEKIEHYKQKPTTEKNKKQKANQKDNVNVKSIDKCDDKKEKKEFGKAVNEKATNASPCICCGITIAHRNKFNKISRSVAACPKFVTQMRGEERLQFVKVHQLCLACLLHDHRIVQCKLKNLPCKRCGIRGHHRLLCLAERGDLNF